MKCDVARKWQPRVALRSVIQSVVMRGSSPRVTAMVGRAPTPIDRDRCKARWIDSSTFLLARESFTLGKMMRSEFQHPSEALARARPVGRNGGMDTLAKR